MITTRPELVHAVSDIFPLLGETCSGCTSPDCQGFIWVTRTENDELLRAGFRIAQINGSAGPRFLDHFPLDAHGRAVVDHRRTGCPARSADGRCSRHDARPTSCVLYPLGLQRDLEGTDVWALHLDCPYVRTAVERGEALTLVERVDRLIGSLDDRLHDEIVDAWTDGADLLDFTDQSDYLTVRRLERRRPRAGEA